MDSKPQTITRDELNLIADEMGLGIDMFVYRCDNIYPYERRYYWRERGLLTSYETGTGMVGIKELGVFILTD